jgi:AcrR family transcriptional regulator
MTPTTAPTRYPVDARAERILAAALDEFARRGFAAARESSIARHAGVSFATLKEYFPTKSELFREVVRSTVVTTLQTAGEDGPPSGDSVPRLRHLARTFWRTMSRPEHAAMLRLSFGELARFPELALLHATEVMGGFAARLERALADGAARGELRVADPRTTARVILSSLVTQAHWLALPSIYGGLTGGDRARAEAAVLEVLVEVLRVPQGLPVRTYDS